METNLTHKPVGILQLGSFRFRLYIKLQLTTDITVIIFILAIIFSDQWSSIRIYVHHRIKTYYLNFWHTSDCDIWFTLWRAFSVISICTIIYCIKLFCWIQFNNGVSRIRIGQMTISTDFSVTVNTDYDCILCSE